MRDPIHLFRPTFRIEETLAAIRECLECGWTGLGFKTVELEQAWREYTGLPHAHFVNSATAGLHLAVRLLKERDGWRDGDAVISTPFTFVSTNHVLLYERLSPVFADIDEYLCLDPASVRERLTPRTRAVMFVGLGGSTGRLPEIAELCRERGLRLILDASHMAGTRLDGRHVGGEGDVAIFSFQAVKNLPTADSGMVCFADGGLDAECRRWTWLGINKDTYTRTHADGSYRWLYEVEHVGFKYHGNSIMAAIALVGLRHLDEDNAYRRRLASWYDEALAGAPRITPVPVPPGCESSRHLYQVLVPERDRVMVGLNAREIYPGVHYRDNRAYRMYAGRPGACPNVERASRSVISLPLHLRLDEAAVREVAGALREVVTSVDRELT
ncbi:MAG TPA: DegT/DnrJ/EryC1/StrS family aminotransferase [Thermoanaerobaculaceae bacterium]|nr:DegT/DnrJ/EryC1/StrS family aminotransferase [Thermoanaerobaculaceae bacterium]HRS15489.1 DegT/DnrJ/EryC1/StrS family aminotransferase [Thermoanaerobaculaceae bacterium]